MNFQDKSVATGQRPIRRAGSPPRLTVNPSVLGTGLGLQQGQTDDGSGLRAQDTRPQRNRPDETVAVLLERMTDRRIRHLPVMSGGRLIGIVSIGDLVKSKIAETEAEAETLKAYITAG